VCASLKYLKERIKLKYDPLFRNEEEIEAEMEMEMENGKTK
jgi:hypothetical protein